jgi:CheY-like chemotaxis protein
MLQSNLSGLVVEDEPMISEIIVLTLRRILDAQVAHQCLTNASALSCLEREFITAAPLDFITTDINHPGGSGIDLIRAVRSLPDSAVVSRCLRARHIPIVVVSAVVDHPSLQAELRKIDSSIRFISKPFSYDELARQIVESVGEYRHRVLADFHALGLAIFWDGDRYRLGGAYELPPYLESEFVVGSPDHAGRGYTRLVMLDSHLDRARMSVTIFEGLINDRRTLERDFQAFFERHPEFLLEDQFDSYWAEPRLQSLGTGKVIRPDFVLQPIGARTNPWSWRIIDLKGHDVEMIANRKFHADLSRRVHRVIAQLRDYGEFFEDPRNQHVLFEKFGGVKPTPNLMAIIGRLPKSELDLYSRLRGRLTDVVIKTYDEVLEFRKAKIERMHAFQSRRPGATLYP